MTMPYYKISGAPNLSGLLKWEVHPEYSREDGTLLAGDGAERKVTLGMPLAKLMTTDEVTVAAAAAAGNTGDGVLTMATPAVTTAVKEGLYTIVCTDPAADGGTFEVSDPDGKSVGTAKVGTAFGKQIKFTIADGAADFVAGDRFTVLVTTDDVNPNAGKFVAYDPNGTDGSEVIFGFAGNDATAADGVDAANALVVIARQAIVFAGGIVWPDGTTDDQKSAAMEVLEKDRGILVRTA